MFITCPCGKRIAFKRSELLTMAVNPSQKGGRKFQVRYCMACMVGVKARAQRLADKQKKEFQEAATRQREFTRDIRGY